MRWAGVMSHHTSVLEDVHCGREAHPDGSPLPSPPLQACGPRYDATHLQGGMTARGARRSRRGGVVLVSLRGQAAETDTGADSLSHIGGQGSHARAPAWQHHPSHLHPSVQLPRPRFVVHALPRARLCFNAYGPAGKHSARIDCKSSCRLVRLGCVPKDQDFACARTCLRECIFVASECKPEIVYKHASVPFAVSVSQSGKS